MSKEKHRKRLWAPAEDSDAEEQEQTAKRAAKAHVKGPADHEKSTNSSSAEESSEPVKRGRRNKRKDCQRAEKVVSTWERAEERLLQQAMAASLECSSTGADGVALPLPGKIFVTFMNRRTAGESTIWQQGDDDEVEVEVSPSTTPEILAEIVTTELAKRGKGAGGERPLSTKGKRLSFGTDWGFITKGKTLEAYDIRQGAALFCIVEDP